LPGGFITTRDIFEHAIWKNIPQFRMFFLIYGNAVHSHKGVTITSNIHLKRGQWLRSYRQLQQDLAYVENNAVRTYSLSFIKKLIAQLEAEGRITTKQTQLGTLFTVVNYNEYQTLNNYQEPRTGREQANPQYNLGEKEGNPSNREHTENRLRTDREHTENNKKNDKNDKNDIGYKECCDSDDSQPLKYPPGSIPLELARHLRFCILQRDETTKVPPDNPKALQSWATEADRMVRLDKRDPQDAAKLMEWCQQDEFWCVNILSMRKFRLQYDRLKRDSQRKGRQKKQGMSPIDQRMLELGMMGGLDFE